MPAVGGSSAPRSIAGTARSSSGPSARPVSAIRIGWNSAFAFLPRPRLHLVRDRAESLAIEPRRRRQLLGQRRADRRAHRPRSSRRGRWHRRAPPTGVVVEQEREPRRHLISRSTDAVAIAIADARNSSPRPLGAHRDAGLLENTAPTARRAGRGPQSSDSAGSPTRASPRRTRRRCARRARARSGARARRSAAARRRRPTPGDQPISAR